jgi:elongation factor Ts
MQMASETDLVKELRDKTGAGILACRSALKETQWDIEKAVDALRKKGLQIAAKREGRACGILYPWRRQNRSFG